MKIRIPELLAPVGGRRQLEAAVNNGADAVYMGGSMFNARIKADNFNREELTEAIDYSHERDVRVYITLNTLLKDSELGKALEYANFLYGAGADAIIVQDLGLARLLHKYLPDFNMHLSTQGTVYNTQALETVRSLGFTRVVPARELSLEDIRKMCGNDIEIEVFIHGALCMCYSGQCQMSRAFGKNSKSDHGTRSGNRGLCAQPCRLPYRDDKGRNGYFLSPKDICALELIPELIKAGVDSFKIEGRLKPAEYVATVTRIYRKYLDMYAETGSLHIAKQDRHELLQAFNRGGFTTGYLNGNPGSAILSGDSPKNTGIYIGRVERNAKAVKGKERFLVDVRLDHGGAIQPGDGVEIRAKGGADRRGGSETTGNIVTYLKPLDRTRVRIGDFAKGMSAGALVYKVTDKELNQKALATPAKKVPVTMEFEAFAEQKPKLTICDRNKNLQITVEGDFAVEKAIKKATAPERIAGQLARLGETPFEIQAESDIRIEADEGIVVPVSVINNMRREAAEELMKLKRRVNTANAETGKPLTAEELETVRAEEKLGRTEAIETIAACSDKADDKIRLVPLEAFMADPRLRENGSVPYILNVSKGVLDDYIEDNFDAIVKAAADSGIAVGNLGWISRFVKAGLKVYGDYGLNVYNSQCARTFEELGVKVIRLSHETGLCDERFGGRIPLMITEHPVESDHLTDRKGVKHEICKSGDKYLIF